MLQTLQIENFTIITALELEFQAGMTVLTGETGAGKSILIDALLLALGGRADSSFVQPGSERCVINATFAVAELAAAQNWLAAHELHTDSECILRRVISADGRSRAFINGQSVPLQSLRELGNLLISIHGQHEHQALLKADRQRALLDAYAGHQALVKKVQDTYARWRKTQDEFSLLRTQNEQRAARQELLSYQVQELDQLDLQPDEMAGLDQEQRQLANVGQLLTSSQHTLALLADNEEANILNLLHHVQTQLMNLQTIDNSLTNINELANNALIQLQEAESELRRYQERVELNPERLAWVEQRLSAIHDLARKHRTTPENLLQLHQQLQQELQQLENSDVQLKKLQQEIAALTAAYQQAAVDLGHSRQQAAKRLSPLVEGSMQELGMKGGRFVVEFETYEALSPAGLERVEFYVSANPGQPLQPLGKVASGGELSRISLAIHVLTTQNDTTPTLIFDEVDTGIGGGTAEVVGRLLRTLSATTQVFCVTHLPQVAAQGHQHLQINKTTAKNKTITEVRALNQSEKIQEIARMLGGVKITQQTLAHAKEMLEAV